MSRQDNDIPMRLRTTVDPQAGRAVIRVAGEIDLATAPLLYHAIVEQLPAGYDTTIHLGDVTFMGAAGIRVLLQAHQIATASRRRLTVANATGMVARVLRLTEADHILTLEDSDC